MSEDLEYEHDADGKSKEEIEKEIARKKVEEKTGITADRLNEVARKVLKAGDDLEKQDTEKTKESIGSVIPVDEDLVEKMRDNEVAENIVKGGLGAEHLSDGTVKLSEGINKVMEAGRKYSAGSEMGDTLEEACNGGQGIRNEKGQEKDGVDKSDKNHQESENKNREDRKESDSRSCVTRMAQQKRGR